MADNTSSAFAGYQWAGLSTFQENSSAHRRAQALVASVDWTALCHFASELNHGRDCNIEPGIAMGGNHIVRILEFGDGVRWLARLRMPRIENDEDEARLLKREVDCLQLIKDRTSVPVPSVFGYLASRKEIGAGFILMECLPGNVAMDLNFNFIPEMYKSSFYEEMARFHVSDFILHLI